MIDPVLGRAFVLCLGAALAVPAAAADLPRLRGQARYDQVTPPVVVPAVPPVPWALAPTASFGMVPAPRRDDCQPGFMEDADGTCRRTGALLVACGPYGGPCRPLPPTPMPYGVGPYLRTDY